MEGDGRGSIAFMRSIVLWLVLAAGLASAQSVDERLAEQRRQIDAVDQQIVELLNRRASIVHRVGEIKKEAGLPVSAPGRERQVLDRAAENGKAGPLPPAVLRRIYETILLEMRTWEAEATGAAR